MMIVPALVTRGMNDRLSVNLITPEGFRGLKCSANRQDRKRQKSVPVPKRIATRKSSTSGEIWPAPKCQPGEQSPSDDQADADRCQGDHRQQEGAIDQKQHDQQKDERRHGRSIERGLNLGHVVTADHRVAGPA